MNPRESAYWDAEAANRSGLLQDNVWKRCEIVSRILRSRPVHARILEIGVGQGTAAAVTNLVTLGLIDYTGTDVSEAFCKFVHDNWRLNTVHTDVRALPDGPFEMVWCFDSLEHVRPEEREAGNAEIARVLDEHAVIMINAPWGNESLHDDEFDWPYDESDIIALQRATGTTIARWEHYSLTERVGSYLWVELAR